MGRSQVKYNRTHGRPGTKGRGSGRGRAAEMSRQQQPQPQGDNAWRFEKEASDPSTEVDLQLLDLETQTLPQYSENEENEDDQQLVKGINVSSMGKALDQLSVAQRLGIPSYLTVDLEVKDVNSSWALKDGKGKSNEIDSSPLTRQVRARQENDVAEPHPSDNNAGVNHVPTKEDDGSTGNEDDLDAWLDSVIT